MSNIPCIRVIAPNEGVIEEFALTKDMLRITNWPVFSEELWKILNLRTETLFPKGANIDETD